MSRSASTARSRLDGRTSRTGTGRAAAVARLVLDDAVAPTEPAPVKPPHGGQPVRFPGWWHRRQPLQFARLALDAQRLELWTSTPQVEISAVAAPATVEAAFTWGVGRPKVTTTRRTAYVQALVDAGAIDVDTAALLVAKDKRAFINKLLGL